MKIKGSYETEIYATQGGYIAIKQPDPMGGDNSTVLLSAHQLSDVIAELQAALDDRASWENGDEHDALPPLKVVGGNAQSS